MEVEDDGVYGKVTLPPELFQKVVESGYVLEGPAYSCFRAKFLLGNDEQVTFLKELGVEINGYWYDYYKVIKGECMEERNNKVVMIYSGGMDSFTMMMQARDEGKEVFPLSFNYGQRHSKELTYAIGVCTRFHIEHKVIDITSINELLQGSALTSDIVVPHGNYAEDSMKSTVVPNRNAIMLNLAIGYAISIGADTVYFGAHGGDHDIYPDCRPEFVEAAHNLAQLCDWHKVAVEAPFINIDKGMIAVIGRDLKLDYGMAWTCYEGGDRACGKCGACTERLEAMDFAGIEDPLEYDDKTSWKDNV